MSQIRTVYHGHEPGFPATAQHPNAVRYYVAAGGAITEAVAESAAETAAIIGLQAAITAAAQALETAVDAITEDRVEILLATSQIEAAVMALSIAEAALVRAIEDQVGVAQASAEVAAAQNQAQSVMAQWANRSPEVKPELIAAQIVAQEAYAEAFAKDMINEQRAYLARITGAPARTSFINATRKARAEMISAAEQPDYVVDSIGAPTKEEIEAVLNPPKIDGVESMAKRQRADSVAELERRMSVGASQEEINRQLLDLLKE